MLSANSPSNVAIVVGLGLTGQSCLEYLTSKLISCLIYDDNEKKIQETLSQYPQVKLCNIESIDSIYHAQVIASPGIPDTHPLLIKAKEKSWPIITDMELFITQAKKPVLAITGTNGKSTTTTLLGACLSDMGYQVFCGGNLGTPVLNALKIPNLDYYVLEVSSFQLDRTPSWHAKVAALLNIAPDHLDRYQNFEAYKASKHRIFNHCEVAVYNRDDTNTYIDHAHAISFGTSAATSPLSFGIETNSHPMLCEGSHRLMPVTDLTLVGEHQWANVLAVLSILKGIGISYHQVKQTLCQFKGLSHRSELVHQQNGIDWINDSKATNVSAVAATLKGLRVAYRDMIWIAGGLAKTNDFHLLRPYLHGLVSHAILMGKDADLIAKAVHDLIPVTFVKTMEEAVALARSYAQSGTAVLLSPACASFDMFNNFAHRGDQFKASIKSTL